MKARQDRSWRAFIAFSDELGLLEEDAQVSQRLHLARPDLVIGDRHPGGRAAKNRGGEHVVRDAGAGQRGLRQTPLGGRCDDDPLPRGLLLSEALHHLGAHPGGIAADPMPERRGTYGGVLLVQAGHSDLSDAVR